VDEHKVPVEAIYKLFNTSHEGLSSKEAALRLEQYGTNELRVKKEHSELLKFLKQFTNFFAVLLLIGALLAAVAEYLAPGQGNLYIAVALFGVVLLNAIFTYLQEFQSERIMEEFEQMLPQKIAVLRDGKEEKIEAKHLVPGDIIILEEGDKIPADGRLIMVDQLKVDHSPLTGESEPQLRKLECTHDNILESRNMVFSGTLVQSGDGRAVVYATGMATQMGRIVQLTKETKEVETPLRKQIVHFSRIISAIAIGFGLLFFFIGLAVGRPLIGSLIFSIGIIVANVPEGLLPTVTLALSLASKRMAKKHALIKHLESVETLGSTTVICTDKTGTITENRMAVKTLVLNGREYSVHDPIVKHLHGLSFAWAAMALCNNAFIEDEHEDGPKRRTYEGDPTEVALLEYAESLRKLEPLFKTLPRIHESPFDSKTKRMITTHKQRGKQNIAYMKGAPEVLFQKCTHMLHEGKEITFTPARERIEMEAYRRLASRGERVLALAYKLTHEAKVAEHGFVYVGLVGMLDPPRPEIKGAIAKCRSAGIRVFMITGDYGLTAESIARQVGLYTGHGRVVLGEELERMDEKELSKVLDAKELVFARTSPLQKLRIVKALQAKGHIVTVTGDGVNDAPALKNADMGVAMGISGTDVAKESSKMILMDDNFATIVNAVEEGRIVYDNIKKFIIYILASNIPELLPFLAFVLLNVPLALTVALILSIDLGTDLLPAIALGGEAAEHDVMKRPPRSMDDRLVDMAVIIRAYVIVGVIEGAAGFFAFFTVLSAGGWHWGEQLAANDLLYRTAVSAFFAAVIVCQVANVFASRLRRETLFSKRFFSNKLLFVGIAAELLLLAAILYVPALHPFFGTAPLTLGQLLLGVPFAVGILALDELVKLGVRHGYHPRWFSW